MVEWSIESELEKFVGKSITIHGWTRKPRKLISVEDDSYECYMGCDTQQWKFTFDDGKSATFNLWDTITVHD